MEEIAGSAINLMLRCERGPPCSTFTRSTAVDPGWQKGSKYRGESGGGGGLLEIEGICVEASPYI